MTHAAATTIRPTAVVEGVTLNGAPLALIFCASCGDAEGEDVCGTPARITYNAPLNMNLCEHCDFDLSYIFSGK